MYALIWSNPAKEDYWQNIDFLISNWSLPVAKKFITTVDKFLEIIQNHPKTFANSGYKNVRSVPIVKQITLFYRINETNQTIEIIRFWNNHQNPKRFKLKS
jgi:plasmid stabilization system protein ParE